MLKEVLNYPLEAEDLVRDYGIAVILMLGSIFVIPALFLLGYFLEVIRTTLDGENQPPRFENFGKLFIDGLKFLGVVVGYIVLGSIPASLTPAGESLTALQTLLGLIALAIFVLFPYMIPSALVKLAREDSIISAFNLKAVSKTAFTLRYLKGVLSLIGLGIGIGILQLATAFALIITVIGIPAIILILPAIRFYGNLAGFRIMAKMAE